MTIAITASAIQNGNFENAVPETLGVHDLNLLTIG